MVWSDDLVVLSDGVVGMSHQEHVGGGTRSRVSLSLIDCHLAGVAVEFHTMEWVAQTMWLCCLSDVALLFRRCGFACSKNVASLSVVCGLWSVSRAAIGDTAALTRLVCGVSNQSPAHSTPK